MAAYPDSKGVYLCELLATDKYRETEKFNANATLLSLLQSIGKTFFISGSLQISIFLDTE